MSAPSDVSYTYQLRNRGFTITSDWRVLIDEGWVTVPRGFHCDLASVPRPFRIIPGLEPYELGCGSVFHDWAYRRGGKLNGITISRKRADRVFYTLMKADGVGWQAPVAFWAVRLFGWLAFRRLPRKPVTFD